jgi:hypothetical protein
MERRGDIVERSSGLAGVNWNALTPRQRRRLIVDLGVFDVESHLGCAAERCATASNYVRGVVSNALGTAGTVLSEIGDAIAPVSEDVQHD